jgi:NAD(P)H dehydrogenase (quinone)
MSTLAHHGIIFVPFGYSKAFHLLTDLREAHGGKCLSFVFVQMRVLMGDGILGSPWGAGTFAGADGSRVPTALEKEIANTQGKAFYEIVSKVNF